MMMILVVIGCLLVLCREVQGYGWKLGMTKPLTALSASSMNPPPPDIDLEYFNRPGPWDEKDLNSLLEANKVWSHRVQEENPRFFDEIRRGHAPKILWISCSDARVPANEMIGEPPGSVFVHRNIANQVSNTDVNCHSVIQYAVGVLKVKHIVVCGHYDCGGVRAATLNNDHGSPLENWLRNIRDTYRIYKDELDGIEDLVERRKRLVEKNVIEQCLNVYKTAVVQKRRLETYELIGTPGHTFTFAEPQIHAMVYDPSTGELTKLPVDFRGYIEDLRSVYELYDVKEGKDFNPNQNSMVREGWNPKKNYSKVKWNKNSIVKEVESPEWNKNSMVREEVSPQPKKNYSKVKWNKNSVVKDEDSPKAEEWNKNMMVREVQNPKPEMTTEKKNYAKVRWDKNAMVKEEERPKPAVREEEESPKPVEKKNYAKVQWNKNMMFPLA